jgi:hypothetical protein
MRSNRRIRGFVRWSASMASRPMAIAAPGSAVRRDRSSTTTMSARSAAPTSRSRSATGRKQNTTGKIGTTGQNEATTGREQGALRRITTLRPPGAILSGGLKVPDTRSKAARLPARNERWVVTPTAPSCRASARNHKRPRALQIALAAILTISASSAVLNTNEMTPCTVAVRRMILSVIPTSETCAVIPITNEK